MLLALTIKCKFYQIQFFFVSFLCTTGVKSLEHAKEGMSVILDVHFASIVELFVY